MPEGFKSSKKDFPPKITKDEAARLVAERVHGENGMLARAEKAYAEAREAAEQSRKLSRFAKNNPFIIEETRLKKVVDLLKELGKGNLPKSMTWWDDLNAGEAWLLKKADHLVFGENRAGDEKKKREPGTPQDFYTERKLTAQGIEKMLNQIDTLIYHHSPDASAWGEDPARKAWTTRQTLEEIAQGKRDKYGREVPAEDATVTRPEKKAKPAAARPTPKEIVLQSAEQEEDDQPLKVKDEPARDYRRVYKEAAKQERREEKSQLLDRLEAAPDISLAEAEQNADKAFEAWMNDEEGSEQEFKYALLARSYVYYGDHEEYEFDSEEELREWAYQNAMHAYAEGVRMRRQAQEEAEEETIVPIEELPAPEPEQEETPRERPFVPRQYKKIAPKEQKKKRSLLKAAILGIFLGALPTPTHEGEMPQQYSSAPRQFDDVDAPSRAPQERQEAERITFAQAAEEGQAIPREPDDLEDVVQAAEGHRGVIAPDATAQGLPDPLDRQR